MMIERPMTAAALAISAVLVVPDAAAMRADPDALASPSLFVGALVGAFGTFLLGWTAGAEGPGKVRAFLLAVSVLAGSALAWAAALGAARAAGWPGRIAFAAAALLALAGPASAVASVWRERGGG